MLVKRIFKAENRASLMDNKAESCFFPTARLFFCRSLFLVTIPMHATTGQEKVLVLCVYTAPVHLLGVRDDSQMRLVHCGW